MNGIRQEERTERDRMAVKVREDVKSKHLYVRPG